MTPVSVSLVSPVGFGPFQQHFKPLKPFKQNTEAGSDQFRKCRADFQLKQENQTNKQTKKNYRDNKSNFQIHFKELLRSAQLPTDPESNYQFQMKFEIGAGIFNCF